MLVPFDWNPMIQFEIEQHSKAHNINIQIEYKKGEASSWVI